VTDTALLLDGMIARMKGQIDHHYALRAPDSSDGSFLGAAIRGEGRYQLGVLTDSPWSAEYEITIDPEANRVLFEALNALDELGHGLERITLEPSPEYAKAFRAIWQAGATGIPVVPAQEALLEPLTLWLIQRGRELSAQDLAAALSTLTAFERSVIRQFSSFDAIITPTLAMTPRPLGWYDSEDGERNFAQQVAYTPFTSFVNVSGLPAITLPVGESESGLPMGVQLIGRPGGEATLLAIGAQLERRFHWDRRHPAVW
jgi:amidase